tara:strand:- start:720 stop:1352 length:633 start_codon:yes stop_codon:yes gene_type:complete
MLVKDALNYGKISNGNTKMPGTTYAVDAFACKVGSKLRNIPGSICSKCYTIKLQKLRPSVDQGYKTNLLKWVNRSSSKDWVDAIVFQINRYCKDGYHRWFDGGDCQSLEMLKAINEVAKLTPHIKHWLPTKEKGIVKAFGLKNITPNLIIRVSSAMIDGQPLNSFDWTSTVHHEKPHYGFECGALKRGNNCGSCRACWNKEISNISYKKH